MAERISGRRVGAGRTSPLNWLKWLDGEVRKFPSGANWTHHPPFQFARILHPDAQITAAAVWQEYLDWSIQNNERDCLQRPEFARRLEALGLRKVRCGHDRDRTWLGICRRQDAEGQHMLPPADVRADADVNLQ